jgi:hypothetical protein
MKKSLLILIALFFLSGTVCGQSKPRARKVKPGDVTKPTPSTAQLTLDQLAAEFEAQERAKLRGSSLPVDDKETLRGIQGVTVLVESIRPEIERDGLTQSQIIVDVELRLRRAGVRVLTREEGLQVKGEPLLYVNLNVIKAGFGNEMYIYSVSLQLDQDVWLARADQPVKARGRTWETGSVGVVGSRRLQSVREEVSDMIDKFLNDFLAANPK